VNMPKSRDKVVEEYMEIFKQAYHDGVDDRRRMVGMQKMFDNVVDESTWPTTAKMSLPLMMSYVSRNIPHAWEAMFPKGKWIQLMPAEEEIDIEQLTNSEYALNYTLKRRMRLHYKAYPTILDSFKFSVGFGIIEPCLVTPMRSYLNQVYGADRKVVAEARAIGPGAPRRSVRYRYIVPGQIVVTNDGTSFNGDDRVSVAFFVDDYSEQGFRDLVASEPKLFNGFNVEDVIKEARKNVFDSRTPIVNTIAELAGIRLNKNSSNKDFPVRIPVVKVYAEKRHIWIANGTTRMFDSSSDSILRCPLQKAAAGQDGKRFYPMSIAEACQTPWYGYNVYISAMYDMLSYALNPLLAYDKTRAGMKEPERGQAGYIGTYGPVRDSIGYLSPPQIGADVFSIGDRMLNMINEVTNRGAEMSPGMVRGGGFALADLMKSSYGQQAMTDAFMSLGFIAPCADQTLALMQEIITEGEDKFTVREYNPQTEEEYLRNVVITEDDLIHSYEIEPKMHSRKGSSALDLSERQAEFDRLSKMPFVDQYENVVDFLGDEDRAKRLLFTRKRVREMQEQERMARLQNSQGQAQGAPGSTPAEQAAAGAEAIAPQEAL